MSHVSKRPHWLLCGELITGRGEWGQEATGVIRVRDACGLDRESRSGNGGKRKAFDPWSHLATGLRGLADSIPLWLEF